MVFQNCLKFEISLVVFMPNIIHKSCYYLYKYIEKLVSLSSSEPPTGYPSENRNKHVGDSGKKEKAGASTHFFSAQCPRHAFFYPSPQPPCDTMRSQQRWEGLSITCRKGENYLSSTSGYYIADLILQTFRKLDWYHHYVGHHCFDRILHLSALDRQYCRTVSFYPSKRL